MNYLSKNRKTIFIGQAVSVPGTAMSTTLVDIKKDKKIELPVTEEMQMGITVGMLMSGLIPVSIYPRWNFLLLSINQLVNHLDKLNIMTKKQLLEFDSLWRGILPKQCSHCRVLADFPWTLGGVSAGSASGPRPCKNHPKYYMQS